MSRRENVENVPFAPNQGIPAHAGLWANRYLAQQPARGASLEPYAQHVRECAAITQPAIYDAAFQRWRSQLEAVGARTAEVNTLHRLAVGHGRESVTETGLTLHHTYGVPYIPGSSLKGVAARFAASRLDAAWQASGEGYRTLFGTTAAAGYVTFLDALPVSGEWQLRPDVITVHHPDYYQNKNKSPAEWDNPTPLTFLSVTGRFLLAVLPAAGAEAWAERALELLKRAVAEMGVGGKTSSGYGRLGVKS